MLKVFLFAISALPLIVLRSWVVTKIWGWFLTPLLHAPSPSIVVVMGIASLVLLFQTNRPPPSRLKKEKEDDYATLPKKEKQARARAQLDDVGAQLLEWRRDEVYYTLLVLGWAALLHQFA